MFAKDVDTIMHGNVKRLTKIDKRGTGKETGMKAKIEIGGPLQETLAQTELPTNCRADVRPSDCASEWG